MNNRNAPYITMKGVAKLVFFFSSLFSSLILSNGVDTITTTQFLTNKNTLVSSGGTFEMGFFSSDNFRTWFLGIWYKKVSNRTVVWTANRDTPLNDTSGTVLKFNEKGILSLLNNANSIIWSANSSRTTQNPVARLSESGNLVVVGENDDDDPNNYLWQSFDHPTDTFMAGMKLGVNFVTGVNRFISNGKYTYGVDPHGSPQPTLEDDSVKIFRSGPWNGVSFSGTPGLRPNNFFKLDFVFNKEEGVNYSYSLIDSSVYSRVVLNENGVVQRFTWNQRTQEWFVYVSLPQDNCDLFASCYGYGICNINKSPICGCLDKFVPKNKSDWDRTDWSSGCVRRTPLDCKNGDGFVKYSGIKLPDASHSWYDMRMNLEECKNMCLKNCTCMAYANSDIRGRGSGCLLWFEDLRDIRVLTETGQDIYIRMASSELDSTGSNSKKKWKRMGIGLALLVVVLLAALSLMYARKKKKKAKKHQKQQQLEHLQKEKITESQTEDLELPMFNLATISDATMNFSVNNKIGEGGFGPVYKGILEEGEEIAVKRLSMYSAQGLNEFKNEVVCITKLQHRNLVRLLGCCIQEQEKMLIYEYMPNNSLDSFLFDHTRSKLLDWPKRFNIIIGTARGLLYLHQDSHIRIIHRDLKAANILLDNDMNPKISDFGMARSFGGNETSANTKRVVGTYGYMSPEYVVDGIFSVKSDVFSFGVLVLEIVSGRRNRGFSHLDHHHNLLGHAWLLFEEGRSLELIDANLSETCYVLELLRSIHVGLLCVQQHPEDRPSMSSVVHMLGSEGVLPRPKEPGFFTKRNLVFEVEYASSSNAQFSTNEMSTTLLEAR